MYALDALRKSLILFVNAIVFPSGRPGLGQAQANDAAQEKTKGINDLNEAGELGPRSGGGVSTPPVSDFSTDFQGLSDLNIVQNLVDALLHLALHGPALPLLRTPGLKDTGAPPGLPRRHYRAWYEPGGTRPSYVTVDEIEAALREAPDVAAAWPPGFTAHPTIERAQMLRDLSAGFYAERISWRDVYREPTDPRPAAPAADGASRRATPPEPLRGEELPIGGASECQQCISAGFHYVTPTMFRNAAGGVRLTCPGRHFTAVSRDAFETINRIVDRWNAMVANWERARDGGPDGADAMRYALAGFAGRKPVERIAIGIDPGEVGGDNTAVSVRCYCGHLDVHYHNPRLDIVPTPAPPPIVEGEKNQRDIDRMLAGPVNAPRRPLAEGDGMPPAGLDEVNEPRDAPMLCPACRMAPTVELGMVSGLWYVLCRRHEHQMPEDRPVQAQDQQRAVAIGIWDEYAAKWPDKSPIVVKPTIALDEATPIDDDITVADVVSVNAICCQVCGLPPVAHVQDHGDHRVWRIKCSKNDSALTGRGATLMEAIKDWNSDVRSRSYHTITSTGERKDITDDVAEDIARTRAKHNLPNNEDNA